MPTWLIATGSAYDQTGALCSNIRTAWNNEVVVQFDGNVITSRTFNGLPEPRCRRPDAGDKLRRGFSTMPIKEDQARDYMDAGWFVYSERQFKPFNPLKGRKPSPGWSVWYAWRFV